MEQARRVFSSGVLSCWRMTDNVVDEVQYAPPPKSYNGKAIVTLCFGILSVGLCWVPVVGCIFAFVAVRVGNKAIEEAERWTNIGLRMAKIGWWMGAVAFFLGLFIMLNNIRGVILFLRELL